MIKGYAVELYLSDLYHDQSVNSTDLTMQCSRTVHARYMVYKLAPSWKEYHIYLSYLPWTLDSRDSQALFWGRTVGPRGSICPEPFGWGRKSDEPTDKQTNKAIRLLGFADIFLLRCHLNIELTSQWRTEQNTLAPPNFDLSPEVH